MGSLIGSIFSGDLGPDTAGDAADAQAAAAAQTDATNRYIFDKQVSLQEPFRQGGLAANNSLMYLMGLGGSPNGTPSAGAPTVRTADQLRQSLLGQYTTAGTPGYEMPESSVGGGGGWSGSPRSQSSTSKL